MRAGAVRRRAPQGSVKVAIDPRLVPVGDLVSTARLSRGLTQGQLAARLRVGQQRVSSWERGASGMLVADLLDLAAALEVPPGTLLPG